MCSQSEGSLSERSDSDTEAEVDNGVETSLRSRASSIASIASVRSVGSIGSSVKEREEAALLSRRHLHYKGSISKSISLRFKDLSVYIGGVFSHVEWCIRWLWCSSIIFYNTTNVASTTTLISTLL